MDTVRRPLVRGNSGVRTFSCVGKLRLTDDWQKPWKDLISLLETHRDTAESQWVTDLNLWQPPSCLNTWNAWNPNLAATFYDWFSRLSPISVLPKRQHRLFRPNPFYAPHPNRCSFLGFLWCSYRFHRTFHHIVSPHVSPAFDLLIPRLWTPISTYYHRFMSVRTIPFPVPPAISSIQ